MSLLLVCWGGVISCKTVYKTVEGVNRTVNFASKTEYLQYYSKKYGYRQEKIFFVESEDYGDFMRYIQKEKVAYFYGITVNDSTKIDDAFLNADNTCSGRVSGVIQSQNLSSNFKRSGLAKFNFQNSFGSKFDNSKGKSVIFLISTKFGRTINKDIKRLTDEIENQNNPDVNYFLLSADGPNSYNGFTSAHQP